MSNRTRRVKNPFHSDFFKNKAIIDALNEDELAVAVLDRKFNFMENININIDTPHIDITAMELSKVDLGPAKRYIVVERALMMPCKYAAYDAVGTNMGTAEERFPTFITKHQKSIVEKVGNPPVALLYNLSKGDLFSPELINLVKDTINGPVAQYQPFYDLSKSLSDTLLIAAAQLRVEALIRKGLANDLHITALHKLERIEEAKALIKVNETAAAASSANAMMRQLLEEEAVEAAAAAAPKKKKAKAKPKTIAELFRESDAAASANKLRRNAAAAAAAVAVRASDDFLRPGIDTLNEKAENTFMKNRKVLNQNNYFGMLRPLYEHEEKKLKQQLLKLRRAQFPMLRHLRANIVAHRNSANKGGSAAKFAFRNRIDRLRRIRNLIPFVHGYKRSVTQCSIMQNPVSDC